jgi:hypothetical protein
MTARSADETPPARWRSGGLVIAGGLAVSAVIHLTLVGTVLFVSPRLLHPEPANPVTVDLVTPQELAAASDERERTKPDRTPDAAADKPAPVQPDTQSAAASRPPPPSDAFASPLARPAPSAPPADPPPAPTLGPAEQLARLLGMPQPVAGLAGGGPSDDKADLSPEDISAFAEHLKSCWSETPGLAQATKLKVVIRVSLRRDGALAAEPTLISAPASMQGPPLVLSAMRTLKRCQPYSVLPAAKYDEWRLLDLQFTGAGLSTASPVPLVQRTPQRPG